MRKKEQKEVRKELRLERYWDDRLADYQYRLVEYLFDKKNEPVKDEGGVPTYSWRGGGDKEWARRQSKHYGLSIVEGN